MLSATDPQSLAYYERVYAGVLGKIIGVYLGRPFEGWSYDHILRELGEIRGYVHERRGHPLIVTDDDISGTFTFFRALEDQGYPEHLTPNQVAETWLNTIIEGRTILWWGGMGMSTEHTAFLRLKHGVSAPESGSIARNGQVVAEQIGAQIFIDAWGLASPGNPAQAAAWAEAAARVSHDGEAVFAAQLVAVMVSLAFESPTIPDLLDSALRFIPEDCLIRRLVDDLRDWRTQTDDWRVARAWLEEKYGYEKYGGGCHVIPNHGLIILALLYGNGDFDESMMIVNTCGWDTDCNSGNVGCLLGVLLGLEGLSRGYDWRGSVADRMLLPTADGGRAISDAVRETDAIVRAACRVRGLDFELPKAGARFHFSLPGSVQGFLADASGVEVGNEGGHLRVRSEVDSARVVTATYSDAENRKMGGYSLLASPQLWSGQTVRARVRTSGTTVALTARTSDGTWVSGESVAAPDWSVIEWTIPILGDSVPEAVGFFLAGQGELEVDWVDWDQTPPSPGTLSLAYSVAATSQCYPEHGGRHRLIQDEGVGLAIVGEQSWTDAAVEVEVVPHLAAQAGIAVRVLGLRRYYSLELRPGKICLVRRETYAEEILSETPFDWQFGESYILRLSAKGESLAGEVLGGPSLRAEDPHYKSGAFGVVLAEGRAAFSPLRVL